MTLEDTPETEDSSERDELPTREEEEEVPSNLEKRGKEVVVEAAH